MGLVNSFPRTPLMNCMAATRVLSSRKDLTRHKEMNVPISFSAEIRSAKSGMAKFSGSFLSTHDFHYTSFLDIESGSSRKNASGSPLKWCLLRARMFNHVLSWRKLNGLALSVLMSKAAPLLSRMDTSFELILAAVWSILKHIMRMKVILSFSNSPLLTYL